MGFDNTMQRLCLMVLSMLLAWLTTVFIERPIRFGRFRAHGAALSVSMLTGAGVVAIAVTTSQGVPFRFPAEIRSVVATMHYQFQEQARLGRCWFAAAPVLTDTSQSVGQAIRSAWAIPIPRCSRQVSVDPMRNSVETAVLLLITDAKDACSFSNREILAEVRRWPPQRVILYGAWNGPGYDWRPDALLSSGVDAARSVSYAKPTSRSVLVGPTPHWDPTLPLNSFSGHGKRQDIFQTANQ